MTQPQPKSVVLTIETINTDGSRTILKTEPMNGEEIRLNHPDDPSRRRTDWAVMFTRETSRPVNGDIHLAAVLRAQTEKEEGKS